MKNHNFGRLKAVDGNVKEDVQRLKVQSADIRDYYRVIHELVYNFDEETIRNVMDNARDGVDSWLIKENVKCDDYARSILIKQMTMFVARDFTVTRKLSDMDTMHKAITAWQRFNFVQPPFNRDDSSDEYRVDIMAWNKIADKVIIPFSSAEILTDPQANKFIYGTTRKEAQVKWLMEKIHSRILSYTDLLLKNNSIPEDKKTLSYMYTCMSVSDAVCGMVSDCVDKSIKELWRDYSKFRSNVSADPEKSEELMKKHLSEYSNIPLLSVANEKIERVLSIYKSTIGLRDIFHIEQESTKTMQ